MDSTITILKILIYFIFGVCLLLLIVKRKKLGKNINYFILATLVSYITNVLGKVAIDIGYLQSNHIVFNFGILLIAFFLYLFYFYRKTTKLKLKRIQFSLIVIFLLSYLLFLIFDKDFIYNFPINFYFVETSLLIVSIGVFLYQTFKTELVLSIKHYFPFWAALGLLVLYCGLLPILFFGNKPNLGLSKDLFFIIMFFINFIGYGIIIRGTLLSKI